MQTVSEIMTRNVQFVAPHESLQRAAQLMDELDVGALPVCDGERLVGMVTDRDITVRGAAAGLAPADAHVDDVMSTDVRWCFEDQPIDEVMAQMSDVQIRRVPVVSHDEAHRLVGIVSLGDLATRAAGTGERLDQTIEEISSPSEPDRSGAAGAAMPGRSDAYGGAGRTRADASLGSQTGTAGGLAGSDVVAARQSDDVAAAASDARNANTGWGTQTDDRRASPARADRSDEGVSDRGPLGGGRIPASEQDSGQGRDAAGRDLGAGTASRSGSTGLDDVGFGGGNAAGPDGPKGAGGVATMDGTTGITGQTGRPGSRDGAPSTATSSGSSIPRPGRGGIGMTDPEGDQRAARMTDPDDVPGGSVDLAQTGDGITGGATTRSTTASPRRTAREQGDAARDDGTPGATGSAGTGVDGKT